MFDSVRVYESQAHVHFGGGKMSIDSLRLHTAAATLDGDGRASACRRARRDTVTFSVTVDSLGGLRRYLSTADTTRGATAPAAPADSLSGNASLDGKAFGTMDLLNLSGRLDANNLYINKDRGEHLGADVRSAQRRSTSASGSLRRRHRHGDARRHRARHDRRDVPHRATRSTADSRRRRRATTDRPRRPPACGTARTASDSVQFDVAAISRSATTAGVSRSPARFVRDSTRLRVRLAAAAQSRLGVVAFIANVPNMGRRSRGCARRTSRCGRSAWSSSSRIR